MVAKQEVQIESEAAKALSQWKCQFAEQVVRHAKRIAAESGHPNLLTLTHYRLAAAIALPLLAQAIDSEVKANGSSEPT